MLVNGTFEYPAIKRVNFTSTKKNRDGRLISIINIKAKVIERALLNYLEIIFEGAYI
jgi:hypothetical protein